MMQSLVIPIGTFTRALASNDVLRGSAAALALKFGGSVLGFAMFALAARNMDPAAFGSLALVFNAMSFLAVVALLGQETLIVRSWGEYCETDPAAAWQALAFGLKTVLASVLLTALLTALVWWTWAPQTPVLLVITACAFLFCQALMHFSAQFSRVAAGIVIAESLREIGWRLIVVVAILMSHQLHSGFSTAEFFLVASGALIFSVALQGWLTWRALPAFERSPDRKRYRSAWIKRSSRMWLSAMLETTSQYLEVIVIGFVLGPVAAAFYFVAARITNVFAMISGGIISYATSRISALFHGNANDELQRILLSLAVISAMLATFAIVTILAAGKFLLWIFGAVYVSVYPELIVLALGALAASLSGPAAYLLLLTGHEGVYPRIMAFGLLTRFILIALLGPTYGLMGAVAGWSLSAVGISLALIFACRRLVGVDPSLAYVMWRTADRKNARVIDA